MFRPSPRLETNGAKIGPKIARKVLNGARLQTSDAWEPRERGMEGNGRKGARWEDKGRGFGDKETLPSAHERQTNGTKTFQEFFEKGHLYKV